jgi:hypothetical protein
MSNNSTLSSPLLTPQSFTSHKSMLDYLYANNFTAAYNSLKADAGTEYTPDPKAKYAGLLEKKWTSVIRLQKKVGHPSLLTQNQASYVLAR